MVLIAIKPVVHVIGKLTIALRPGNVYCFLGSDDGVVRAIRSCVGLHQVGPGSRLVKLQFQSCLVLDDCLGYVARLKEDVAKIVVSLGVVGVACDGLLEMANGLFSFAQLS